MSTKKFRSLFIPLVLVAAMLSAGFSTINNTAVNDFSLKNVDGKNVSLKDFPNAKGFIIVFTCNHCPFAKLYPSRINDLNKKYAPLGIPVIAISSTDTVNFEEDTYGKMIEKAKHEHFTFPYLYDETQSVAKSFSAQKTPHAFIIWKEQGKWVVKYNGAIDDNGAEPEHVQKQYVANAADELLSGKEVTIKETRSIGCQIAFRK